MQTAGFPYDLRARRVLTSLVVLSLVASLACGSEDEEGPPPVPHVKVFEVGEEAEGQVRNLSGVLAPAEESPLSFGVAGTVDRVLVSQGDVVQRDQLLASLDPEPVRLALEQARARLTRARARLLEAERASERVQRLWDHDAVSRADLEVADANRTSAEADLRSARTDVENAERDLRRTRLTAPFAGRVSRRTVEPFQEVTATEPVFLLQSGDTLVVKMQVPETLLRYLDYAQPVRVRFPGAEDLDVMGQVSLIGAQAGDGNAFPVEVRLPKEPSDLRAGMSASVAIHFAAYLEGRTHYLVPLSAIAVDLGGVGEVYTEQTEARLFVVDEAAGRARLRTVRINGLRGNRVEVYEGLEPGEKVITAGVPFLRDGMKVEIWRPEAGLADG